MPGSSPTQYLIFFLPSFFLSFFVSFFFRFCFVCLFVLLSSINVYLDNCYTIK